jgi:hypothetical protein
MRNLLFFIKLLLISFFLQACSASEAFLSDKKDNLANIGPGSFRSDIEERFGLRQKTVLMKDFYSRDYYLFNDSGTDGVPRAIMHSALNVVTLGTWEIFGNRYENNLAKGKYLVVVYDPNDFAKELYLIDKR